MYFGDSLRNRSDQDVVIDRVTERSRGALDVSFAVDLEGPARGEVYGSAAPGNGDTAFDGVLSRLVPAQGARIPGDASLWFYTSFEPDGTGDDATVTSLRIEYHSASSRYVECIDVAWRVPASGSCDQAADG